MVQALKRIGAQALPERRFVALGRPKAPILSLIDVLTPNGTTTIGRCEPVYLNLYQAAMQWLTAHRPNQTPQALPIQSRPS